MSSIHPVLILFLHVTVKNLKVVLRLKYIQIACVCFDMNIQFKKNIFQDLKGMRNLKFYYKASIIYIKDPDYNSMPLKALTFIATTQPTTQNNLKQLLLLWYYYR